MTSGNGRITNKDLYDAVEKLEEKIENNFVRKEAFIPVQKIVYGLVAAVGMGVVGSILAIVLKGSAV